MTETVDKTTEKMQILNRIEIRTFWYQNRCTFLYIFLE